MRVDQTQPTAHASGNADLSLQRQRIPIRKDLKESVSTRPHLDIIKY